MPPLSPLHCSASLTPYVQHEPGVLHNLKFRYVNSMIYTFSGPILIAINPYKRLPIYTADLLASYARSPPLSLFVDPLRSCAPLTAPVCSDRHALTKKRTPHVYAIGDQAYRTMRTFNSNQSILVTGERSLPLPPPRHE